jgi:hypothetical protein
MRVANLGKRGGLGFEMAQTQAKFSAPSNPRLFTESIDSAQPGTHARRPMHTLMP